MMLRNALAMMVLVLWAGTAHAAITCNVSSSGFAAGYSPTAPAMQVIPAMFTVTCTRGLAGDANFINFAATAGNGLNPQGQNNRAALAGQFIRYDVFRDVACASKWKGTTAIIGTVSMPAVGTFSTPGYFWGCIIALQAPPAGVYSDSVLITIAYGASTAVSSFPVVITTPGGCTATTSYTYL